MAETPENKPTSTANPSDPWIARSVVISLGTVTLTCVIGGIVVAAQGGTVPGEIIAIGGSSGGALAALLSRTH